MEDTIGVDISKDTLDAYWLSSREHRQFCNDKAGVKALAFWAKKTEVSRVIFEATGIYHRCIETGLAQHGVSFARVNPRQARRFCEGAGQLAKTDRVDAAMLAKLGALLELKADQPKDKTLRDLKQLATAKLALIKDRTAAKARLAATTHKLLAVQIKRRLTQIERDLCKLPRQSTPSLRQTKISPRAPKSSRAFPPSRTCKHVLQGSGTSLRSQPAQC